jgi:hypothetical protein
VAASTTSCSIRQPEPSDSELTGRDKERERKGGNSVLLQARYCMETGKEDLRGERECVREKEIYMYIC